MRPLLARIAETARLMIGQPPYEAYRTHMAANHPDQPPMTRAQFFRNRQDARFNSRNGRCC
ncbi:YbdD/YjiX family protein [Sphingomonas sp. S2-65]|nr:YbdD/YjiX family protein [Sphingomonas sp. S2-65]UYY60249.1 YbdD/YjiX family protein [Sphingomonas sp. S2-65]